MKSRPSTDEKRVVADLPKLKDGSYVVVWHIVSHDGHPETGAFTFSVGAATATTADIRSLVASRSSGRGIGIAFGADRALGFFTCLVLVGGLAFARWRWPAVLARRDVRRMFVVVAGLGFVAALASVPLQAAYSTGDGASAVVDGSALSDVIAARFGGGALVRAGLIAVLAAFAVIGTRPVRRSSRIALEVALSLLGLGVFATFAYAGHGFTGRWRTFGLLIDITHLGAASLWLGGLVLLGWALRKRTDAPAAAQALKRFSGIALTAVAVIVIAGTLQGWRQIGTWSGLWHTSYGRLLIIKVLLVLAIVVIASAGRDVLRDRRRFERPPTDGPGSELTAGPGRTGPGRMDAGRFGSGSLAVDLRTAPDIDLDAPGFADDWALASDATLVREVRRGVLVEAGLAVVVLSVTSLLVVTPPSREAVAAAQRPQAQTVHLEARGRTVVYDVAVQPTLAGENTIVVTPRLLGRTGFLPSTLTATVQAAGTAARSKVTFTPLANGRWAAVMAFSQAGQWTVVLTGATLPTSESASVAISVR